MTTNNKQSQIIPIEGLTTAQDCERAVVGACIIDSQAYQNIEWLKVSDFSNGTYRTIFECIRNLAQEGKAIDFLTISNALKDKVEITELASLLAEIVSSAHIVEHAKIVHEKAMIRALLQLVESVKEKVTDMVDLQEILEFTDKGLTDLSLDNAGTDAADMGEAIRLTIDYISRMQHNREKGISTAISTGLSELDKALNGGWNAPDLIVLGGRPSMGKTQFAVHFASMAARAGKGVLFISIEMTIVQLILRMLTEEESISFSAIKTGQVSNEMWQLIDEKMRELEQYNLNIADDSAISDLARIKTLARRMARAGNLDLLIIDYLQLIRTGLKFGTRDLEIGYITRELKMLAKELNVPVILLAQVSRPPKGVKVQVPKLEDLRESGNIEQDADVVIFPHRPIYYDDRAIDELGESWVNRGYLVIAKNREGERDKKIFFEHDARFKRIWQGQDYSQPQPQTENEPQGLPF